MRDRRQEVLLGATWRALDRLQPDCRSRSAVGLARPGALGLGIGLGRREDRLDLREVV
jgi:hypothetical protein